jgi:hypothetical protein
MTLPIDISVVGIVSLMFIADGINVPSIRTCIVGVSMVTSRISVRELPISGYESLSWLRRSRIFLGGISTRDSTYCTAGSSVRSLRIRDEVCDSHHKCNATESTRDGASFTYLGTRIRASPGGHVSLCFYSM